MNNQGRHEDQPGLWGGAPPSRRAPAFPGRQPTPTPVRAPDAAAVPPVHPTRTAERGELWTIDDVAVYLGVPKQTIYSWRHTGYGPKGFRVGKHLRWRSSVVVAWTREQEAGA